MLFSEPFGFEAVVDRPVRVAVAERDLSVAFDRPDRFVVGLEIALAVGDGEFDHLARRVAAGEAGRGVLDPQMLHFADETAVGVAHQHARQEARFAENLEAVADAEHQSAARRMVALTACMIGERAAIAPQRR